jgi:hypothetical protein
VDKAQTCNFVMRGDHNLVEPVIPARAKFRCPATKLWRNILSYGPQDAANVPAEPANVRSNHLPATELLHGRNRSEVTGERKTFRRRYVRMPGTRRSKRLGVQTRRYHAKGGLGAYLCPTFSHDFHRLELTIDR